MNRAELNAELALHQLEIPADQVERMVLYRQQLVDWNGRLNLTRHTDLKSFVTRDVLDSWHLASCITSGERILDVGTGGGVPGLLLAILRPDLNVSLCDSVGKKAVAVAEMARALELPVAVYGQRAEQVLAEHTFDSLVLRAVGPLKKILRTVLPHWSAFGRLLMIKGPSWTDERRMAREDGLLSDLDLRRLARYRPPGHYGDSVILAVFPKANS